MDPELVSILDDGIGGDRSFSSIGWPNKSPLSSDSFGKFVKTGKVTFIGGPIWID